MRIGILTFHWATNYGAVLQCYALQEYLQSQGYTVQIVNYKPKRYDSIFSIKTLLKRPYKILSMMKLTERERLLSVFREKKLKMTERFYSEEGLKEMDGKFDMLISGSDQILNPFFTMKGEGKPTSVYYLGFAKKEIKRIGYAVSFGCTEYPAYAKEHASSLINNFDKIGLRESTGKNILSSLGYNGSSSLVPDPTILYGQNLFKGFNLDDPYNGRASICIYLLRGEKSPTIKDKELKRNIISDYGKSRSLERWLSEIKYSKLFVTNSYHGTIMAILFHVPFFAILNTSKKKGMNDRFITLLNMLGLQNRIIDNGVINDCQIKEEIDWISVDKRVSTFQKIGEDFLSFK